jgi:outer membrane receptor for Fe3+-dicitrate
VFSQQTASLELTDPGSVLSLPGASSWSIRLSGLVQTGGDNWDHWYDSQGSSPSLYDDHLGANGVQGFSMGIDIAVEYRITNQFALGVAVGYIPTQLCSEVHYYVPNKSILEVEKPDARMPYFPVRLTAGYDLFRGELWSIQLGVQCGVALFSSTDVHLNVGKSRRFYGDRNLVMGCQVGTTYIVSKGLAVTSFLQYQSTSFKIEELGTGDLQQTFYFKPVSLLLGLQYTLGD